MREDPVERGNIPALLEKGVKDGVFPGAVLLVAKAGQVVFFDEAGYLSLIPEKIPMRKNTIFDLASLTKPLATTLAAMKLVDEGKLGLDEPLDGILRGAALEDKARLTPRLLLCHSAGLVDWKPFYLKLGKHETAERKRVLRGWIIEEPFAYKPGEGTLYSDLGFMLLEWVIEQRAGEGLAQYVEERFYGPLRLERTFFSKNPPASPSLLSPPTGSGEKKCEGGVQNPPRPPFAKGGNEKKGGKQRGGEMREGRGDEVRGSQGEGLGGAAFRKIYGAGEFAATEDCPWRKRVMQGEVGDENAYALGGWSGHAGLFGTAEEVHVLVNMLREHYYGIRSDFFRVETIREFFRRQDIVKGSDWALGWDTRALEGSSAGRHFSRDSVGHTGFTGTSIWMDLEKDVVAILLTNRVHPTRNIDKIKAFRPTIHDLIMEELGLASA